MFFISFLRILPLDEFFYEAKSFQILQNQYKFSMILFRIKENWRFDMNLLFLKWFCFIENLIKWQNSWKAYKKQTLTQIKSMIESFSDTSTSIFWSFSTSSSQKRISFFWAWDIISAYFGWVRNCNVSKARVIILWTDQTQVYYS